MKTDMKNMFKGKNKLILALPIILILLFGTVLYLDKDNTAKASTSSSPVVMEPPVEETKAVREKIAAYEMEAKRQREEEEAEKESHIEEGDVFFSADEKREICKRKGLTPHSSANRVLLVGRKNGVAGRTVPTMTWAGI